MEETTTCARMKFEPSKSRCLVVKTGKFKAWIFQHALLPRLKSQSFSSVAFYGKTTKQRLPLTSVVEEFKTGKTRHTMTLKDSSDQNVRETGAYIQSGHKWRAKEAVLEAESRLQHKDTVGTTCNGKQGLGTESTTRWTGASARERRKLVQQEETRFVKAVEMGNQGNWTRWETEQRELIWSDIWEYTSFQHQFLLRAVYDVLPTPTNLRTWGLTEDPMCRLCQKPVDLEHMLLHVSCQEGIRGGTTRNSEHLLIH